jgi:hypothetical protein
VRANLEQAGQTADVALEKAKTGRELIRLRHYWV